MKKTDIAYVAGIVDGEGSICLNRSANRKTFSVVVTVTNTNVWLVQWLKFAFGGSIYLTSRQVTKRKSVYTWRPSYTQSLEFLKLIYPYLRLKKPQAEIAI